MVMVHTSCYAIIADVTRDVEQPVYNMKELDRKEKRVKGFEMILVEMFYNRYHSGWCSLKPNLLAHTVEDLRIFGMLSVLDNSSHEHFTYT